MKNFLITCTFLFVALVVVSSGCISAQEKTPVTTTQIPPTVSSTTSPAVRPTENSQLIPGPTQIPPANLAITYDVMKDSVYADITVTCRGGSGLYLLDGGAVRVTRSDGSVSEGMVLPRVGANFITNGTKKSDRVEITVRYADGSTYKVYDQLVPFQNIYPYPGSS